MTAPRIGAVGVVVALVLGGLGGCASVKSPDPRYRPSETVLELVATLQRHVHDDTYRFPAARDFTDRNVYRATLIRLENLQEAHADALRAGHLDDVIAFAKGRALERLRAYHLAALAYRRAAERKGRLRHDALQSAALCDALDEAAHIGWDPDRPVRPGEHPAEAVPSPTQELADYARRRALLEALLDDEKGTHYEPVIREELERADESRARYFLARRRLTPGGDVRALAELQRVVVRHRESKNENRHLLALANLYATLAREYVDARPPDSLWFDPPTFQDLVDSASHLYQVVANQDGTPEKIEASRRLEAFLAFTLRVDRDRFSP